MGRGDWTRTATSKPVLKGVDLKQWVVIFPEREKKTVRTFCETLSRVATKMGLTVALPKPIMLQQDRTEDYLKAIRDVPQGTQIVS